jgi:hypothetical protein
VHRPDGSFPFRISYDKNQTMLASFSMLLAFFTVSLASQTSLELVINGTGAQAGALNPEEIR